MQGKVNLDLLFCLDDKGFSLDELVYRLKELFENNGFTRMLELILSFTAENIYLKSLTGDVSWECCDTPRYISNGAYNRKLKTSLGIAKVSFSRLKCSNCGRSITPLKEFLKLKKFQRKSTELEQLVIDAVSKDSYRRAVESIDSIGFTSVPYRTAHRWVMESECSEIDISDNIFTSMGPMYLLADGTKYKGMNPEKKKTEKGDLKVLLGVNTQGDVFPVGTWTGTDWESVSNELKQREVKFPEGTVLVSDGEPGLADSLSEHVDYVQRCHWHIVRDLYHAMWQDGGRIDKSRPLQKCLAGILAIDLPEEDFNKVTEKEKDEIEERMENAISEMNKLIAFLTSKGYSIAAGYLSKATCSMFSYIRRWLKYGIICPRASSLIERIIRELGRRLKKIAYNWSAKGALKLSRIILKKFTDPEEWDQYWKNKMGIVGSVVLNIMDIRLSQDLAH